MASNASTTTDYAMSLLRVLTARDLGGGATAAEEARRTGAVARSILLRIVFRRSDDLGQLEEMLLPQKSEGACRVGRAVE